MVFTEEMKTAFARYEELKQLVREANAEIENLKPTIMEAVPEGVEVKGANGMFTVRTRSSWKYTDKVKQFEKNLKQLKADEEATGDAEQVLSHVLYYTSYDENGKEKNLD